MSASANEHAFAYFSDPATPTRPARIVVAAGADQTGKNIALDRYGRISGTVSGPSGGLTGATVRVYRWSNPSFVLATTATTAAGGGYTVTGLNPGNYRVGFTAATMTPEFHQDKADVELADDVAVALNGTASISATMASNQRTLSGTVTSAAGGAPLSGAEVQVERRVQTQDDVRWRVVDTLTTPANGTWTTSVPDGTYRIGFSREDYLDQWYSGASVVANATAVVVAGSNRTGLNAAMSLGGTIKGTLTGPAGAIDDGYVTLYREVAAGDFDHVESFSTSATGAYTATGLPPGAYKVEFGAGGHVKEYWNDKPTLAAADPITVTVGSTSTADATVAAARKLSGTVTGPTGAPLGDADVTIEARYDDGDGGFYWDDESYATTAPNGAWVADVGPGTFRVRFEKAGHVTEWWNDASTPTAAQSVVVTTSDVTSLNAQMASAAILNGRVSGPGGPVDASVTVYPAGATDLATAPVLARDFAPDGQYVIDTLPAGSYKIRFEAYRLLPEFHNDKADLASANPVTLSASAPVTVDATLARGRSIAGTVTGVGGAIGDGSVAFYKLDTDGSYDYVDSDDTDADGGYRAYLPAGTYKLRFSGYDNRISEWWNNAANQAIATTVALAGSDVTGIDAVLDDGATVSGVVTFPQRRSGWDDRVVVLDATTGAFAGSAAVNAHSNAFSVSNLPPGTYRAQFARDFGYDVAEAQFYSGKAEHLGVGSSQTFALAAADTRTGVDAVLVEGGRLAGRVRDTSSNPVAGCVVTAYTTDGSLVGRQSRPSAADGTYAVPGLTTGSYRLQAEGGGCGSSVVYYDGVGTVSPSSADATSVSATRGTSTAVPQDLVIGPPDAPPMVNNTLPAISDTTPQVGQALTATSGTWTPADGTYSYQWLSGGSPITGATTSAYTAVGADAGKVLAVRVTASRAGRTSVSVTSANTAAVSAGEIAIVALPTISDTTPEVGQALTATTGTWNPSDGTYAYEWFANGTPIAGAATSGYTPLVGDVGKKLSVRVTASKAGWTNGVATSAETSAVSTPGIPVMVNTAPPTISDTTPEVGQALTATSGTWNPSDGTYAYQWLADGSAIPGATTAGYAPVAGRRRQGAVGPGDRRRGAGYTCDAATSVGHDRRQSTAVVTPPPHPSAAASARRRRLRLLRRRRRPRRRPRRRRRLRSPARSRRSVRHVQGGQEGQGRHRDRVAPTGVTVKYQWLRNGKAIKKATTSSYKLTTKDKRKKV